MQKVWNITKTVFTWVLVVAAAAMMVFTIVSVNTFDRDDRSIFGFKAYIVKTDSMSKTDFDAGDLILIKETDPKTLKAGDIIAYTSTNTHNYGETVTHKIRKLTFDANGEPGFITYGTTTDSDDENIVTYEYVLGKYQNKIKGVGRFFAFLKTTPGYIVCIFLPFLLLILIQGINVIKLFRKYKKEQMEDIAAEREALETERKKAETMMAELLELKKQMSAANGGDNGVNADSHISDSVGDTTVDK